MKVWVLTVNHRHGSNVEVFVSEDEAQKSLLEFAKEWWSEVTYPGEALPNDDAIVEIYFGRQQTQESYELTEVELQGAPKKLTDDQVATVLAALRYWQDRIRQNSDEVMEAQGLMPENFQDHEPLTSNEIDRLCEALNLGEID